jgi:hypothetical protein
LLFCGGVLSLSTLAAGCASSHSDGAPPAGDDGGVILPPDGAVYVPPEKLVEVDTTAPSEVTAGTAFTVDCPVFDEDGTLASPPEDATASVKLAPEELFEMQDDGSYVVTQSGTVEVVCSYASLGLADVTPARIVVHPAAPATVGTRLDRATMVAGEGVVTATCSVSDAYGNPIPDASPTLSVAPSASEVVDGLSASFTQAGEYSLGCAVAGATSAAARLVVTPNLPASIVVSASPDDAVHASGSIVALTHRVSDRYGNPIDDAVVSIDSAPSAAAVLGSAHFRYFDDGDYTLTATVVGPTDMDVPLTASASIVVNGRGPVIDCDDGVMANVAPGSPYTFHGRVADVSGVQQVTVEGTPVPVSPDGTFEADLTAAFGMNFVDVVATDSLGEENSRTCSLLLANRFQGENALLGDAITLRLAQAAIDDGNRSGGVGSVGDLLHTVLNSQGLEDAIDTAMKANPTLYNKCVQDSPFGCIYHAKITYKDIDVSGPHDVGITLQSGGAKLSATLRNVAIKIDGDLTGPDISGWIRVEKITVAGSFTMDLYNGKPRMRLSGAPTVTVNSNDVSIDIDGVPGWLDGIISSIAKGAITNAVKDAVKGFVQNNFNSIIDGLIGGLDISTLGATFDVPTLSGGTIPLTLGLGFSSVNVNSSRAIFGIGTSFNGPDAHARPTLGVPLPPPASDPNQSATTSTKVAVYVGLFNEVLHTLWRGGFLEGDVASGLGGGLPAGVSAILSSSLPPVAHLRADGKAELGLGGLRIVLTYPGLFDEPLVADIGAIATMDVALGGDSLSFGGIELEQFFFSAPGVSLDAGTRTTLEGLLRALVQDIAGTALNDALPALPIPTFPIPDALGDFGFHPGDQLGLKSPALSEIGQHFVLSGGFGIR